MITSMGYGAEEADAAMRISNFDMNRSIELLLTDPE